jgi:hypothetical protein
MSNNKVVHCLDLAEMIWVSPEECLKTFNDIQGSTLQQYIPQKTGKETTLHRFGLFCTPTNVDAVWNPPSTNDAVSLPPVIVALLGINPHVQKPATKEMPNRNIDVIRFNAFCLLFPNYYTCGVTSGMETGSEIQTGKYEKVKHRLHMDGNFAERNDWNSGGRKDDLRTRMVNVAILDWFWLPKIYYEKFNGCNGYGNLWGKLLIPKFFEDGGIVAILPVDKTGLMARMMTVDLPQNNVVGTHFMSLDETALHHPFWVSTSTVEDTSLHSATITRTNLLAYSEYLDQRKPFVFCWNTSRIHSFEEGCEWLKVNQNIKSRR